jgi:hypothetical protein
MRTRRVSFAVPEYLLPALEILAQRLEQPLEQAFLTYCLMLLESAPGVEELHDVIRRGKIRYYQQGIS